MEKWDLYDKNRLKTGKVLKRGNTLNPDEFRLVVHVCIINSNNQMLIQQRQPFKKGWSNMWDLTASGSVQAGETSNLGAERELFEEIGYKANLNNARPIFTINFEGGFDDYYVLKTDLKSEELTLQETEVKRVKWADKAKIISLIKSEKFIPYHKSVIEMIFSMKNKYGAHENN